ncbi:MAG: VCBS repeat-containing protein [Croceitalea sp.]|nr:VCBS repeat-containing protein [Croceitalea sp.]
MDTTNRPFNETKEKKRSSPIFDKIDVSSSNLRFANNLTEDLETNANLFNFDYFYNGAGVGLEDINNDGLLDVFFCGNQVPNKLFLNKGNFQFEDISSTAGINLGKVWSNGISFVDIDNDGWMDIYVSQGGPNPRLSRKNLLFINQQDNTFVEKAEEFGLADMGISTQSAFFDYDNDGDLDCIVMNENEYYGVDPINLYRIIKDNPEAIYFNSSHLYNNQGGKFIDVTKKAGLERPIFGLGLAVSDINNDNRLDIYIASDYYIPDALFINNGDGTFTDKIKEHTNQVSFYGMGIDIADVNNDNKQDIFVLDMASSDHKRSKTLMASMSTSRFDYLVNKADFHYQYMYNSFQLNMGNNKFNNIAQMTNTANTDWSWSVLMTDYDLDEDKDIYVTNGYRRYALDNDLQNNVFRTRKRYKNNVPLELKKELYYQMPSEKLPNILFENEGNLNFPEKASSWGLDDFTFSNGAAQGDLDNDGDYDLVVNNIDENALLYQNKTIENGGANYLKVKIEGNTSDPYPKLNIKYAGKSQMAEVRRVRGYRSSQDDDVIFGLGATTSVDTLKILWPNGAVQEVIDVKANSTITLNINDANKSILPQKYDRPYFEPSNHQITFTHQENYFDDFEEEILLPYKQSTLGPYMSKGDVDGDGMDDVYVGGASGQAGALFIHKNNGFQRKAIMAFEEDKGKEDMESMFFDFDGDQDLDLFVVSGGYEFDEYSSYYADRLYLNDGKGNFSKLEIDALSKLPKSGKTVTAIDFDTDGDLDILVGNRAIPRRYPQSQPSTLYENNNGTLKDVTDTKASGLKDFGIINKIITTDFNNDGKEDFITVGEWTGIGLFENKDNQFELVSNEFQLDNERGWWYSIQETDVNNDGLKDYIIGNVGQNLKFKASIDKPFKIYATDFDDNGSNDIVLSKKYNGEYVPVRGRECSSQQMPFIKEKFKTYNEFANATLVDVYGEKLEASYQNEATNFYSVLLLNKGESSFEIKPLPIEAQMLPVLSIVTMDVNKDGFEDCILAGNIYDTEVETPRLDALSGTVLLSNQKDGYFTLPFEKSGLQFEGNIKNMLLLQMGQTTTILASQNNGGILLADLKEL